MSTARLLLCRDAVGTQWELGAIEASGRRLLLLGWQAAPASVDAEMPADIAAVLVAGLLPLGDVAYLESRRAVLAGAEQVQALDAGGLMQRFSRRLAGWPADAVWVRTSVGEVAEGLFKSDAFVWHRMAQLGVVLDRGAALPALSPTHVQSLLGDAWIDAAARWFDPGVTAFVRPGVDGDVAAVLCHSEGMADRVSEALKSACAALSVRFEPCAERDFAAALAA